MLESTLDYLSDGSSLVASTFLRRNEIFLASSVKAGKSASIVCFAAATTSTGMDSKYSHPLAWLVQNLLFGVIVFLSFRATSFSQTALDFQLPKERTGHSFSLWARNSVNPTAFESQWITVGSVYNAQEVWDENGQHWEYAENSYLQAWGNLQANTDYYILDETTGETTPLNRAGTVSFWRTSFVNTPWMVNDGSATTRFAIILPENRQGHSFVIRADGAEFPLVNGATLMSLNTSGFPTWISYGFFEAWAGQRPQFSYRVIDQSTNEQTDELSVDNRDLVERLWSPVPGPPDPPPGDPPPADPPPSQPATIQLTVLFGNEGVENSYELHSSDGSLTWLYPTQFQGYDSTNVYRNEKVAAASIGINTNFWITRSLDGAIVYGSGQGTDTVFSANFPPYVPPSDPPSEPPPGTPLNSISVRVGENHWSESVWAEWTEGITTMTAPLQNGTLMFLALTDALGQEYYRYNFYEYQVQVGANYRIRSSSGHADNFMDGYAPPSPPYNPTNISIQVGENHWWDTITVHMSSGDLVQATPDWSNAGYMSQFDGNGNEYYRYNYVFYTATVDANQSYIVTDGSGNTALMDGFNPPPPPPPPGDPIPAVVPLQLQIHASRWQHQLEVQTAWGTFPVTPSQIEGSWHKDESGNSSFSSLNFFSATSSMHENTSWTVRDLVTGDVVMDQNDLSNWAWGGHDADQDGVEDWLEQLMGTDPNKYDTNGDGISDLNDLWQGIDPRDMDVDGDGLSNSLELSLGSSPFNNADWALDKDSDGINNLDEVRGGTDPFHTTPRLVINVPANAVLSIP